MHDYFYIDKRLYFVMSEKSGNSEVLNRCWLFCMEIWLRGLMLSLDPRCLEFSTNWLELFRFWQNRLKIEQFWHKGWKRVCQSKIKYSKMKLLTFLFERTSVWFQPEDNIYIKFRTQRFQQFSWHYSIIYLIKCLQLILFFIIIHQKLASLVLN